MTVPHIAPYGAWRSPIDTDMIVTGTVGLSGVALDGVDIYWKEARPAEGGRNVIVRRFPNGETRDLTPSPFNVRSRVHEYGGAAHLIHDGTAYFVNYADQSLYRQEADSAPVPISRITGMRYADMCLDTARGRLVAVREDHTGEGREAVNTIVSMELDGGDERVLVSGNDFYANPRLSPDGAQMAWLCWSHPAMPWDGTELWTAPLAADGSLGTARLVAGGPQESIFQPEWSPSGVLHFVSDRTDWWNLYRYQDGRVQALYPTDAEFGLPQWVFGMATYAFTGPAQILCTYTQRGIWHAALLDTDSGALTPLDLPYTDLGAPQIGPGFAVFTAASSSQANAVVRLDLDTKSVEVLRRSSEISVDEGYLSIPESISFPTEGDKIAHAFYYPPQNRAYRAPAGERPPLLVKSHGGPTGATDSAMNLEIQYWTSRGVGVLDVNYGGSTGFGRAYRQRLNGEWGVVDVDDCVNGARYLIRRGDADGGRVAIDGGSAGGYTTLCAITFRDFFKVGASYYGVSDIEALARDTHKFESRYMDTMIGPYPAQRELYVQRSPIHHTSRLSTPLILFQGLEDAVVPPNQAEMMFEAVRAKGLPVAYLPFAGEQHGFRRAQNIKRALEAEFYFFARVFGYTPADPIEPVRIENLPEE